MYLGDFSTVFGDTNKKKLATLTGADSNSWHCVYLGDFTYECQSLTQSISVRSTQKLDKLEETFPNVEVATRIFLWFNDN